MITGHYDAVLQQEVTIIRIVMGFVGQLHGFVTSVSIPSYEMVILRTLL